MEDPHVKADFEKGMVVHRIILPSIYLQYCLCEPFFCQIRPPPAPDGEVPVSVKFAFIAKASWQFVKSKY